MPHRLDLPLHEQNYASLMPSTFHRDLKKLGRHLVQIYRPSGMQAVFGFVVGSSDELVLLHRGCELLRPVDRPTPFTIRGCHARVF